MAHVFLIGQGQREWVQGWMLRHGHARADAAPGGTDCLSEMMAHEREAIKSRSGLWRYPLYQAQNAHEPRRLLRLRNSFQRVEGRVRDVGVTRSRIYLNFGTDWRTDFTASLYLRNKTFSEADKETLKSLNGQKIRVRGWIERRYGPHIELLHPAQVEVIENGNQDAPSAPAIAGKPDLGPGVTDKAGSRPKKKRPDRLGPDAFDL